MKRIIMMFVLMPLMALATTWYVDGTNGSDSNSGTSQSAAKKTIQAAIDAAVDGDTILVSPGTYAPIASNNKVLHIKGVGGKDCTLISGENRMRCAVLGSERGDYSTILESFTITAGRTSASPGAGVQYGTLKDCYIVGCTNTFGIWNSCGGGAIYSHAIDCTFENNWSTHGAGLDSGIADRCIFRGNYAEDDGGAVSCSLVRNSLIVNNESNNWGGDVSGAACAHSSTNINCTIVGNRANGGGGIVAGECALINCILAENSGTLVYDPGKSVLTNCFTSGNPMFEDVANGDYRLSSGSPCIDAGDNSYVIGETDLDGNARIVNGTVDIGCYEYSARTAVQLWANGPYWATSNVGATLPEEEGYTFLYGDDNAYVREGGTEGAWVNVGNKVNPSASNPAAAYWGDDWRWPSSAEWRNLFTMCDYSFETNNGTPGWLIRGRDSFSDNMIFLPVPAPKSEDDTSDECWLQDYRTDNGDVAQILSIVSSDDSRRIGPCLVHWWGFTGAGALLRAVRDTSPVVGQTYSVCFDIGQYGVRTGGGALSQTVNSGATAIEPTVAAKDGYVFMGWDGRFDAVEGNLTITALYSTSVYSIGYANTKGAENPNPDTYTIEDEIVFEALEDVWGWSFAGWSLDGIAAGSTGDKSVSATWTEKYRTVSFYKTLKHVYGAMDPCQTSQVQEGAAIGAFPEVSLVGYTLKGWYLYEERADWSAKDAEEVDGETVIGVDSVVFAKWTPNEYTVTFDADGGAASVESQVNTFEEEIGKVPSVTKTGYAFLGWYADGKKYPEEVLAEYSDTFWDDERELEYESFYYGLTSNLTVRARWSPVVYGITYAGSKGGPNANPTAYTIEDALTFLPLEDVAGYRFTGWSPSSIASGSTGNRAVTAQYASVSYEISYVDTKGAANTNPTTYTIEDAVTFAPLADVEGWRFVGWSSPGIARGNVGIVTVVANWEQVNPSIAPVDDDEPMDASVANTYDGVIVDADGLPVGYINVKAAKASGKGEAKTSKVTATIQMVGEEKKVTIKATVSVADAAFTQKAADGRILDLSFSRYGIWGTFDDYEIDGVRNLLASKAKSDKGTEAKVQAEAAFAALKGNYVMAYGDESGYNGLSVTVMAKGKVKVSGKLSNGANVSTTTQLIVGSDYSVIPVIYSKKGTSLAFDIYFSNDGLDAQVFGYYDAVISPVSNLRSGLSFYVGETIYDLFDDYELSDWLLPEGVSVEPRSSKWVVADGAKAGKIKVVDGEVIDTLESENPSGLKLTFKTKTGAFTGSFKVYALDGKGKLKTFSASVSGVVVDGYGYGIATIKGRGSFAIEIAE